jgi:restriction system protein
LGRAVISSGGSAKACIEKEDAGIAANTLVCLIHQTNYLLDQQLRQLEERFLKEGGFTERLYKMRLESRK